MAQQVATRTPPPEVHQIAAYYQPGTPAAAYRRWLRPSWIVTSVFFVLAGFFFIPKAIAASSSGAPVAFGSLIISQQGNSKDQVLLPWYQFQKYEISNGVVIIRQHGRRIRWSATAVGTFPNLLVFIALVDYIRRGQGQVPR
jgi:hypothetical protein